MSAPDLAEARVRLRDDCHRGYPPSPTDVVAVLDALDAAERETEALRWVLCRWRALESPIAPAVLQTDTERQAEAILSRMSPRRFECDHCHSKATRRCRHKNDSDRSAYLCDAHTHAHAPCEHGGVLEKL